MFFNCIIFISPVVRNQSIIVAGAAVKILTCTLVDLFRGISSPWCFSERSAVGVPYQNEISASSMKIVKLLSSSDVLKDTTCFERTKYKLFGTDHYFSSGGRGGDTNCFTCKNLIFSFLQQQTIYVGVYIQFISVYCACK